MNTGSPHRLGRHIPRTHTGGRTRSVSAGDQRSGDHVELLRFREVADYSTHPWLAPREPISGRAAYERYVAHSRPHVEAAGSRVTFLGEGGQYVIGPPDDRWDLVMLVRHRSVETFFGMAQNDAYLAGLGHRTAALEDSRLLPIVERDV